MKTTPIFDSAESFASILRQNPSHKCPQEILDSLSVFFVDYISFDGKLHRGQIAAHKDLESDIKSAFMLILNSRFPIQSVVPISNKKYMWDDTISTTENNTSAFNYRYVRNTSRLSTHSWGRALDINPLLNPYFPGDKVFPAGATYETEIPGTILADSILVIYFKKMGWSWGGDWIDEPDYQHFYKTKK